MSFDLNGIINSVVKLATEGPAAVAAEAVAGATKNNNSNADQAGESIFSTLKNVNKAIQDPTPGNIIGAIANFNPFTLPLEIADDIAHSIKNGSSTAEGSKIIKPDPNDPLNRLHQGSTEDVIKFLNSGKAKFVDADAKYFGDGLTKDSGKAKFVDADAKYFGDGLTKHLDHGKNKMFYA